MLDFDGDVHETFMQTFRISYTDVFGANLTHDLKENGDDIPVTKENRQASVVHFFIGWEISVCFPIMQTFRISYTDVFGANLTHDLKENGDDIPVTKENRQVSNCFFCGGHS